MIIALLFGGLIALLFGFLLSYLAQRLTPPEDPQVQEIYEVLPHNNCGGCGFASCEQFAKAVKEDSSIAGNCVIGGREVADKIASILGVHLKPKDKQVARLHCSGGTSDKVSYEGIQSCKAALLLGTFKECRFACLGLGDCLESCPFDAISMVEGLPIIDEEKCRACGKCVVACPQGLLKLHSVKHKVILGCNSNEKKRPKICRNGCIGCGICAKVCPKGAITMVDGLPKIDYDKCINCFTCVEKCPRKVLKRFDS
ncbi:MAG: RnfABCDGE type electron transport complex subunit B [Candidatus Woesearchaeota archaeon]